MTFTSRAYIARKRLKKRASVRAKRNRVLASIGLGLVAAGMVSSYALYDYLKGDGPWPTVDTIKPERIGQNSVVFANDGTRMGLIRSDQNRTVIPLSKMGKWAPLASVAIEDRRFYEHDGYDVEGIARAAIRNYEAGEVVEGGSTITQQVVRNLYEEIDREKTLSRKAKEVTLATGLEEKWSKEKILETYLNLVFYGNYAHGIEAAAQTYFAKPASELTLPEAALLAGLPQKPSEFDPFGGDPKAVARRNKVLEAMYEQNMITKRQYLDAVATPIKLKRGKVYVERRLPYFFDYVEQQLIKQYGADTVRLGGLRVHTTIDPQLQRHAEDAIKYTLNQPGDPSAAMVAIDTKTGEIKAMASSADYNSSKFNLAAQGRRQPGSAAKTWVLAAFLREGVNPYTTYYSSRPLKVSIAGTTEPWEPKTYDHSYVGSISIDGATVRSDNSVYAQMTMDIGADAVADMANKLGVESKLEDVFSIGLGSQVVTPLEQTNVYATIARGGVFMQPKAVKELISPSGTEQKQVKQRRRRVLEDWQAREVVNILENNMEYGTGTGAQIGRPAAGKTGTTDEHNDAWFCGMTPQLTSCVWMGYSDAQRPMNSVHGIRVAGGTFPATIWRRFMEPALAGVPETPWFEPKGTPVWTSWDAGKWQQNPLFSVQYSYDPTYTPSAPAAPATSTDSPRKTEKKKEAEAAPAPAPAEPAPAAAEAEAAPAAAAPAPAAPPPPG